jgi:hypothetical protein
MKLPSLDYPGVHFRQHKKGYYYIEFSCRKTKRRRQITLRDKHNVAEAYGEAKELAVKFRDGEYDPWHDRKDAISLPVAIKEFKRIAKRDDLRATTIKDRLRVLAMFEREHVGKLLCAITKEDVLNFCLAPHLGAWSKHHYYGVLNRFLMSEWSTAGCERTRSMARNAHLRPRSVLHF